MQIIINYTYLNGIILNLYIDLSGYFCFLFMYGTQFVPHRCCCFTIYKTLQLILYDCVRRITCALIEIFSSPNCLLRGCSIFRFLCSTGYNPEQIFSFSNMLTFREKTIDEIKKTTRCNHCKNKGHWARECRKRIAEEVKNKGHHSASSSKRSYVCDISSLFLSTCGNDESGWICEWNQRYNWRTF